MIVESRRGLYLANWITKMSPVGGAACEEEEEGWCSEREGAIGLKVKQLLLTTKES